MTAEDIIDAGYARCGAEIAYGYLAVKDADGCIRIFEQALSGYRLAELVHRDGDLVAALELWARPWTALITDEDGNIIDDCNEEYVFADLQAASEWLVAKFRQLNTNGNEISTADLIESRSVQSPVDPLQRWAICRREPSALERFGAYEQTALKS